MSFSATKHQGSSDAFLCQVKDGNWVQVGTESYGYSEALDRLALIVRGVDTARLDIAPQAAGLLAASLGLSRMHRADLVQLEHSFALYYSFYRWSRDAANEGHNWPTPHNSSR